MFLNLLLVCPVENSILHRDIAMLLLSFSKISFVGFFIIFPSACFFILIWKFALQMWWNFLWIYTAESSDKQIWNLISGYVVELMILCAILCVMYIGELSWEEVSVTHGPLEVTGVRRNIRIIWIATGSKILVFRRYSHRAVVYVWPWLV